MEKNVAILLTRGRAYKDGPAVADRVHTALAAGDRVHVYLMIDGVEWAQDDPFVSLVDAGAKISVCALNAEQRGVAEVPRVEWASQYTLAQIVAHCDEFVHISEPCPVQESK